MILKFVIGENRKPVVEYRERTFETIDQIPRFYKSVGYNGVVCEIDQFFFAYDNDKLIAVVRVTHEHQKYVLERMYMDKDSRGKGIGKRMLESIAPFLDSLKCTCYCIPFSHLEDFYGKIGFRKISDDEAPGFLAERWKSYSSQGSKVILMERK